MLAMWSIAPNTAEAQFLFKARIDYGAGTYPSSVAIGDLDGDGTPDLAVANGGSDNVSVLLGNGDGTFQAAVNYGAGGSPESVAIGDLDGDGDLDLALANDDTDNVSVLLGNGDGTFQAAVSYGAGTGPFSVAIGDLDGDGDLDLAVANEGGNVSVLLGNGDGTFQAAVNYGAGAGPYSVAIGDLDGDGNPDLAVANYGSGDVAILINEIPDLVAITLIEPNGGEVVPSGSTYAVQWLAPLEMASFKLKYSTNNGKKWIPIDSGITDRSYDWTVPTPPKNKTKCLVKVIGYDASDKKVGADKSDSTFTIEGLRVTSPNGGETLTGGGLHTITWQTNGTKKPVEKVVLKYTKNGGTKWKKIDTLTENTGSYDWTVPDVPKTKSKCLVKVLLKDANGKTVGSDMSDGYFTIEPAP